MERYREGGYGLASILKSPFPHFGWQDLFSGALRKGGKAREVRAGGGKVEKICKVGEAQASSCPLPFGERSSSPSSNTLEAR